MKQCPNCSQYCEDNAYACPRCNAPLQPVAYRADNNDPFQSAGPEGKSRGIAGLLALLLGGFGAHYFYVDKPVGGLICLGLSLVTCGLWGTIVLIQGILFFCWSNQEFEEKFVNAPSNFPIF